MEGEEGKDSDDDFNSDGDDEILLSLREQRVSQLKAKQAQKIENLAKGHGHYSEIVEEEFLPAVTKTRYSIVHFYHKDFERCKVVDMHMSFIAKKHLECRIRKLDGFYQSFMQRNTHFQKSSKCAQSRLKQEGYTNFNFPRP